MTDLGIIPNMDYLIRDIRPCEYPMLEEFLYLAIYVPEGFQGEVPRSIIYDDPKCRAAFEGFGELPDDKALVAEAGDAVVGSCWVRTTDEYGHVDNDTPSFSISVRKEHRRQGVGTALMNRMISELTTAGYARASLSVQKENPACRLYKRLGFRAVGNGADETEWLMVRGLCEPFTVIETERLVLRPWLSSDAAALYALARDPAVGPIAGWPPHKSVEDSSNVIRAVLSAPETYAVVLRSSGELVGCTGFNAGEAASMPLAEDERELGYWIGKPHWGRGYATEAARALVERGFSVLGLSGIHAGYYDGNDRSGNVLEKLGFKPIRVVHDAPCALLGETRTEHLLYLSAKERPAG